MEFSLLGCPIYVCVYEGCWFCRLILYPTMLLNFLLFEFYNWFFWSFFGYTIIISSANRSKVFSLPILQPLVDFFCLIPLADTSSTVLNSSRDSGYLRPVPDFSGNVPSVSPLNKIHMLELRCIYVWVALSQSLDKTWE